MCCGDCQIGPQSNLADMLLECHKRIRAISVKAQLFSRPQNISPQQITATAAELYRYFSRSLPAHASTEDQIMVPHLRGYSPELDMALTRMMHEHNAHKPLLSALLSIYEHLYDSPELYPQLRPELATITNKLVQEINSHLEHEEIEIIPTMHLLPPEEQAAMVQELRRKESIT